MNIDDYRAMVAKEKEANKGDEPDAQTQPTTTSDVSTKEENSPKSGEKSTNEQKQTETNEADGQVVEVDENVTEEKPQSIEIDGKEVTLDELKNGYMRQSDYTKKTQEAKREAEQARQALQFMEQVRGNPELAQALSEEFNNPYLDPNQAKHQDLEQKYYDLRLQTEIRELEDKYSDFDAKEVLQIANNSGINDLDTAYHVYKSKNTSGEQPSPTQNLSLDELKKQLRDELLSEIKSEQEANVDTSTVIQTGGSNTPVRDDTPQLTNQELKVAKSMGMDAKEYAKWRDVKNKK